MHQLTLMDITQEVETVKKELVDLIIAHLRENKIEVEKARQLAADFLAVLPIRDQQDLLTKLKNLGEKYEEAEQIYVEELSKVESEKRDAALNQMRDAIKTGNIDGAIVVAKSMQQGPAPAGAGQG